MKASLEKIEPDFGSSFTARQFVEICNHRPFWHFHPEFELVYIKSGSGKRHIGNHISYYTDGDLIFLGPYLPHFGFTDRLTGAKAEIVVQMKGDFLGTTFLQKPELAAIRQLFDRSRLGLSFGKGTKKQVGKQLERLLSLDNFERLLALLAIFQTLATAEDYELLNADGLVLEVQAQDNDRVNDIYQYVREHFQQPIRLEDIAAVVSMTVPAFCRYFKRLTGKTFTAFVNEFRVVHACKLLAEEQLSIADVCFESGFNNFSHFNKVFRNLTQKSPSAYRKDLKRLVQ